MESSCGNLWKIENVKNIKWEDFFKKIVSHIDLKIENS